MTIGRTARPLVRLLGLPLLLLSLLLVAATARGAAYYSTGTGTPVVAKTCTTTPLTGAVVCNSNSIAVNTTGALLNGLALAATVNLPVAGTTTLRLKLNGTAPGGYRAGILLSATSAVLGLNAVGAVTLRTYLGADEASSVLQESQVVTITPAQAQLLTANGPPEQVEFTTSPGKDFNQVEIVFSSVVSVGSGVNIHYAYGIGPNSATQVAGYVSRFAAPAGQYVDNGCAPTTNPDRAVDADLTNYATFSSLATVNCSSRLRVNLEGNAPGTYRAGFVIGNTTNLADADILSSLILRTYDVAGNPLESSVVSPALLSLSALPDGRTLVSFPTTRAFRSVSIEQTGLVTALNSLQLYYGVGVAPTTITPSILSNFGSGAGHYQTWVNGVLCAACGVINPENAAGPNPSVPATVQVTAGVASSTTFQLDLNGAGQAGNRAGMLLGKNSQSLVDATALSNITLTTYDASSTVLETATGSSLLSLTLLADGRKAISFNTTQNFAKVGITIGGVAGVASTTDVYYAFADNSNGAIAITPPTVLPVSLTSFGVRRLASAGPAELSWTTASEVNSASFIVERSAAPDAGFQAIGSVAAAGSSNTVRTYTLRDAGAASQSGMLYYRLRQVDTDGHEQFSSVVVLAASPSAATFSLYPNPVSTTDGSVAISTGATLVPGGSVSIYSGVGQLLSSQVISASDAVLTVPTTGLAAGLYHVVLRDAAGLRLASQRLEVSSR